MTRPHETPAGGRQHPFWRFVGRAAMMLGLAFAMVAAAQGLWPWTPFAIGARVDRLEATVGRLANLMELNVVLQSEKPGTPEYDDALLELRRMRRVTVTKEATPWKP